MKFQSKLLLLFIAVLFLFSGLTAPARAEFFASVGAYGTNTSIDKCTGTCNFTVKNSAEPSITFGYYFKNNILDVGAEVGTGDVDVYLLNVRKRLGTRWAVEAGAGRFRQQYKFNHSAAPSRTEMSVINGRTGADRALMVGGTYSFGKKRNHAVFGRYMYSQMDLNVTRDNYKQHHGRPQLVSAEASKIEITNNTVWLGYRTSF